MAKHDISGLDRIEHKLSQWLREKLSDKPQLEIADFVFPEATGESNVTLIVSASWDGTSGREEGKFVVRIQPQGEKVFNDYNLALQYQLMAMLAPTEVPVPPLLALETDTAVIGSTFYVMHHVDGLIPSDRPPMHMAGWVTEVTPEQRASMWWAGVDAMIALHRLDTADFSLPEGLPGTKEGESAISCQIAMYEALLQGPVAQACEDDLPEIMAWCRENMPADSNLRLCWGDARPANIIYKDFSVAAVLDWEMATVCNPLLDLAWWIWMDVCLSTALGIERLDGFPTREETIAHWQRHTGYAIDDLPYYELFAVLRYTIIMERIFVREEARSGERLPNMWMPLLREIYQKVSTGQSP